MVKSEDVLTNEQTFFRTKDGTIARKGTLCAAVLNVGYLDELLKESPSQTRTLRIQKILHDMRALLPGLHALNLFQLFTPIEWLQQNGVLKEGRAFVSVLYLQEHPEAVDAPILAELKRLKAHTHPELGIEIDKLIAYHR